MLCATDPLIAENVMRASKRIIRSKVMSLARRSGSTMRITPSGVALQMIFARGFLRPTVKNKNGELLCNLYSKLPEEKILI